MEKWIEVTAKTEEEAVANALVQLGLEREDVSVEILTRAKSGFLGIGGTPAKIKVTYEVPDEPVKEPVEKPAAPVKPAVAEKPAASVKVESVAQAEAEKTVKTAPPAATEPASWEDDSPAARAERFLTGLLAKLESKVEPVITVSPDGNLQIDLVGPQLGRLIGRRGETLDAIQHLTSFAVNRGTGQRVKVYLNAEHYREKREKTLRQLAERMAGKVVRYRKNITLESMNAYERHVIHTALQDFPQVTTYSVGTEPNRRIVVAYRRDA